MRVGTPPVIALTALDAALDVWDGVSMDDVRSASIALDRPVHPRGRGALPRADAGLAARRRARGSQVSFRHPEGYAIMQALIARGVIGDFRAPDAIRFGFTPLYIGEAEVLRRGRYPRGHHGQPAAGTSREYRRKALVT